MQDYPVKTRIVHEQFSLSMTSQALADFFFEKSKNSVLGGRWFNPTIGVFRPNEWVEVDCIELMEKGFDRSQIQEVLERTAGLNEAIGYGFMGALLYGERADMIWAVGQYKGQVSFCRFAMVDRINDHHRRVVETTTIPDEMKFYFVGPVLDLLDPTDLYEM